MKILYGVQGTGNGHIARARIMAKAIAQRNDIQADFLFSGRPANEYFNMEVFGQYQTRRGLTFVTEQGAVSKWQTIKQARPLQFFKDIKTLDLQGYDFVVNDFEPVTAWAARKQKVPAISISHQAAFSYDVPKQGNDWLDALITRYFAPTSTRLGVHWHHFGYPIIPPFIEEQPLDRPKNGHTLVYLPFEDIADIRQLLEPLSEINFDCFHPKLTEDSKEGHIQWRKTSKPLFRDSLLHCNGVVANAGFELSSEALRLGKKLLLKPLHGQYEQLSNVRTLITLDLCTCMQSLDADTLEKWLQMPQQEPIKFPGDPNILIDWLIEKNWHDVRGLCQRLWKEVSFPEKIQLRLNQYKQDIAA